MNPSLYLFARDYAQPYVQQGRLGVERELFANTSLSVSYLYFRGMHLSRTRDINLGTPVPTTVTDPAGTDVLRCCVIRRRGRFPVSRASVCLRALPIRVTTRSRWS